MASSLALRTASSSFPLPSASSRYRRRSPRAFLHRSALPLLEIASRFARFPGDRKRSSVAAPFVWNKEGVGFGEGHSHKMAGEAAAAAGEIAGAGEGEPNLLVFGTEEELSNALAKYTAEISKKFAQERGAFSFVVSGGSLIKSLRKLAGSPYVESIDWNKWHVFWVDERVVPKNHADSNYKLAYDGFLSKVPIPEGQIYSINDALSAEGAADDYETCLKQLVKKNILGFSSSTGCPKFDLMALGMGPDGHVASLFPNHPLVHETARWVASIKDSPKPPPERITFTFPVINSSAHVALVATGAGKADPVERALGLSSSSSSEKLPIQLVSPVDGQLTWFTDKEAASKLEVAQAG